MKTRLPRKSEKIRPVLENFKKELHKIYAGNLKQTILFGSYARGNFHSESDIDLLVVLDEMENPYKEIDRISDIKFEFLLKYDVIITCLFSDKIKLAKKTEPVFNNIQNEGIII
ncbi:MAG: nucleotidyltransferase domain-containing protein [Bacteroidales bacterium]